GGSWLRGTTGGSPAPDGGPLQDGPARGEFRRALADGRAQARAALPAADPSHHRRTSFPPAAGRDPHGGAGCHAGSGVAATGVSVLAVPVAASALPPPALLTPAAAICGLPKSRSRWFRAGCPDRS